MLPSTPPDEITLLVEIIHPVTRVIVNYDFVDLVLIGARERHTGRDLSYDELSQLGSSLGLPVVERVDMELARALELAKTLDAQHEGFVLRWPNGFRVKVKSTRYLEVFAAVHGWSEQSIARAWASNTLDGVITGIPEEFQSEFIKIKNKLDALLAAELQRFKAMMDTAPHGVSRKEYALWVRANMPQHLQPLAFDYFDGASIKPKTESYLRRYIITQFCQQKRG
ncbi:hypothetical protein MTAT_19580 [Moorella thermoacetica]|uniref:Uncharacterized protein n=1 Tax=Neomoorella thermoacetica TaxID=1525 RepID=A0ABY3N514_NEOTH|nr:hypothetical protein [Moorella thermoacetica]TYL12716.1 hypothetical protein MTAT_19580 [Moorella thermoacetica]